MEDLVLLELTNGNMNNLRDKIKLLTTDNNVQDRIELDHEQHAAVYTEDKNAIVVAAAGSGKTRVLTERIRHLVIDKGVDPSAIVAVTFTNMAADEMKERLSDVLNIHQAFIGTIHSYANQVLQSTGKKYKLQSDEDAVKYMTAVARKYGSYCSFYTLEDLTEDDMTPAEFISKQRDDRQASRRLALAVEKLGRSDSFLEYCKARNIISFNELIKLSTGVRSKSIEHLLVDEFQDVGPSEYSFISNLPSANRFYVGDDWQSIYSFKGSNVGIFRDLVNDDDDFSTLYISTNYRSNEDIVRLAESELDGTYKLEKNVVCIHKSEESSISYYPLYKLAEVIRSIDDYSTYFILARKNNTLYNIKDRLDSLGVPSILVSNRELDLASRRQLVNSNMIKLMTIHSSKGLESDNVIIIDDMTKGSSAKSSDEEQRVKYVAYTRAKKKLIIFST